MAYLILHGSRRTRQPQGFVQLRPELAASARAFVVGGIPVNFVGKYPVATGSSVYGPTSSIGRTFSGNSGENSIYLSTNIPVASEFTTIALLKTTLVGSNPGLWRSFSFLSEMCIFQGSGYRPWMRIRDNDYLKPSSGPALAVGQDVVVAFRYSAAKAESSVWWDGGKQHTGSGGSAPYADTIKDFGLQSSNAEKLGHIAGLLHCDAFIPDERLREITESPSRFWGAVSVPDVRRIYFGVSGGAGAVTGTSSGTLDAVTGTAAATLAIAATSAATVNAATGSATATLSIAATSSATVGSVTGTAAAGLAVAGTSAQSLAATTGTATGSVVSGAAGTSAATVGTTTGTAAGTLALAATSSATVYVVTGTSAGTIAIGAASAQTLSDVTGTALGNTTGATNGTSAATVGTTTGTAAGYVAVLAASSATLAALSGTAAAQIIVAGSSVGQLGGVTGPEPTGVMGPTGGRRYALRGGAASRPRQANTTRPAAR